MPKLDKPAWLADLELALRGEPDKVPIGWLTKKQIAQALGKLEPRVNGTINTLVQSGKLEARKFRTLENNSIRTRWHYNWTGGVGRGLKHGKDWQRVEMSRTKKGGGPAD